LTKDALRAVEHKVERAGYLPKRSEEKEDGYGIQKKSTSKHCEVHDGDLQT
jgi:hypothetical protein